MFERCMSHGAVVAMALALNACASVGTGPIKMGPTDTGAGTLAAARTYLEGRWTNVSYELFPTGQPPISIGGTGMLTYDGFGNLTIEIRVDEAAARVLSSAGVSTTMGALITSGRTAVDMQARTLTYMLEGQPPLGASAGPVGLNRPRHWRVDGNMLTLTTLGDDGKPTSVGRWQKVE